MKINKNYLMWAYGLLITLGSAFLLAYFLGYSGIFIWFMLILAIMAGSGASGEN